MKVYFNKEQSITYQFDLITLFFFDRFNVNWSSIQSMVFFLSYDLLSHGLREEPRAKSEFIISREGFR